MKRDGTAIVALTGLVFGLVAVLISTFNSIFLVVNIGSLKEENSKLNKASAQYIADGYHDIADAIRKKL